MFLKSLIEKLNSSYFIDSFNYNYLALVLLNDELIQLQKSKIGPIELIKII